MKRERNDTARGNGMRSLALLEHIQRQQREAAATELSCDVLIGSVGSNSSIRGCRYPIIVGQGTY